MLMNFFLDSIFKGFMSYFKYIHVIELSGKIRPDFWAHFMPGALYVIIFCLDDDGSDLLLVRYAAARFSNQVLYQSNQPPRLKNHSSRAVRIIMEMTTAANA